MERVGKLRASLLVAVAIAAGLTGTLLLVTRSSNASGGSALVKTAHNATLGRTILVNRSGLTLYSLSAERHGRFICTTGACLSIWKPLVVARGVTPTGIKGLTVVTRPDARRQVVFHGAPLYRFVQDVKPGEVKGNGFKDVGTWRVVTVGRAQTSTTSPTTTAPPPTYTYP